MNDWAEYLVKKCFLRVPYQSVKSDFLGWYHQAIKDNSLSDEIGYSDPQLVDMVIDAGRAATRIDSDLPIIEMVEDVDSIISKIETIFAYFKLFVYVIGLAGLAVIISKVESLLLGGIIAVVFGISASVPGWIYKVFKHQIKSNSQFLSEVNNDLIVKPDDANREGRNRDQLLGFYLWNRSLFNPKTHVVIILLAVIKVVSSGHRLNLYGNISTELREQVGEFVGENAATVIREEIQRALEGEFGSYTNTRKSAAEGYRDEE